MVARLASEMTRESAARCENGTGALDAFSLDPTSDRATRAAFATWGPERRQVLPVNRPTCAAK